MGNGARLKCETTGTGDMMQRMALRNVLAGALLGVALAWVVQRTTHEAIERAEDPRPGVPVSAMYVADPRGPDVVEALRGGGYIVYFRHAQRQKWDSVIAFDVYELATGDDSARVSWRDAVCLTHQGTEEASMIGAIFRLARIPVGTVLASPSCRA